MLRSVLSKTIILLTLWPSRQSSAGRVPVTSFGAGTAFTFPYLTTDGPVTMWYSKYRGYGMECAHYGSEGYGVLLYFRGEHIGEAHADNCDKADLPMAITVAPYKNCEHHLRVCVLGLECRKHDISASDVTSQGVKTCPQEEIHPRITRKGHCFNDWCILQDDDDDINDYVFGE